MATVETRRITKRFDGRAVVDGIDLAVREGELLVLVGPSGCGKTTLLRMLAGLEMPTGGDVLIGGRVVTQVPPRARNIAMVFQSYALYPHLTVEKNIGFPLRAAGVPAAAIGPRVQRAAQMFGIADLLKRKPRQLSGGERQRVALARAMVREPVAFLLDEPLSNLDAKLRTLARDELKQFQRRLGTTTVYVTHDQVEAMGLGDRIAVLEAGTVHQIGTPAEVYDDPHDTFVATFIGSPPMNLIRTEREYVGVRPEQLLPREAFGASEETLAFPLVVQRIENLGADRLVYGVLESPQPRERVIARLPPLLPFDGVAGGRQEFAVRPRELRRFALADGPPHQGSAVSQAITQHFVDEQARTQTWRDDGRRLGMVLLAPAILYIAALVGFPFALGVLYSVSDATVGSTVLHFVGVSNYAQILHDPTFWTALRNAAVFTVVSQVLVVVLGKILAMALAKEFRGRWLVRLLILLPWVAPISLGAIGWLWIFDPIYSIITWTLHALHLVDPATTPVWLGEPHLAMASVIAVNVWRLLPLAAVIILAGMTAIPQDIHDAAQIDGASFLRHLFEIQIPLVAPVMLVALLFGIVFTFTDMIVIYVLTRGGPYDTTQVLASYAYFTGVQGGDLAAGAAIAVFLFPVLAAVAVFFLVAAHRADVG